MNIPIIPKLIPVPEATTPPAPVDVPHIDEADLKLNRKVLVNSVGFPDRPTAWTVYSVSTGTVTIRRPRANRSEPPYVLNLLRRGLYFFDASGRQLQIMKFQRS